MPQIHPLEIGICVADLARVQRFYEDGLGLETVAVSASPATAAAPVGLSPGGYVVARLQTPRGERIKLLQPEQVPEAGIADGPVLAQTGLAYLTLIVDDLPEMVDRALAAGASPVAAPRAMELKPGVWVFFLRDPEGNVVELVALDA